MRTDELRDKLDVLAGEIPAPDAAYARVLRRARQTRRRAYVVTGVLVVCVAGAASFAVVESRRGSGSVTVVSPAPEVGDVADMTWTRVAAPPITVTRVVNDGTREFAVGSTDAAAAIDEIGATGTARTVYRGPAGGREERRPAVNDLVGVRSVMVAVGQDVAFPNGEVGAAAWRSVDGGRSWKRLAVDQPIGLAETVPSGVTRPLTTISRIVVADGTFYAFGSSWAAVSLPGGVAPSTCNPLVWTSEDGIHFRLAATGETGCSGFVDATDGPAGVLAVASGSSGAAIWAETSGTWTVRPTSGLSAAGVTAIGSDDNGYVAVGSLRSKAAIWWSADGSAWTRVVSLSAPETAVQEATVAGVAHTDLGWVAAWWQIHAGRGEPFSDLIVWTSKDGQNWTRNGRDAGTFEQYAYAVGIGIGIGIGVEPNGIAIVGTANITGLGTAADPVRQDSVLWFGSPTHPAATLGTVEGTMRERGGPPPGLDKLVDGTLIATDANGRQFGATIGPGGGFSMHLPAGRYTVVGHSPGFGSGKYDCDADGPVTVDLGALTYIQLTCPVN
jgi:hypothetical protein